ncbi:MAG TPA: response regulator [Geobacteraceae bacterium]|nr:response regulator [Geobacteraceae bacterium]
MDRPLNVLIVEDSEDDTLLLLRKLRKSGYETCHRVVDTPESMKKALSGKEWDVVIADNTTPGFSGTTALKIFKESGINLPFIIVSGKIGEETAVGLMKAGAYDYVVKGRLERLVPAIERGMQEAAERRMLKEAETALRESEARYRSLLESVTDYIYTVHLESGQPVSSFHGPGCRTVTGFEPEDFSSDPLLWYRMVHEEDRPAVLEQAKKVMSGHSSPLEHRIIHKDGDIRWVRNTPVLRSDTRGHIRAYDGLISDITERKNLENQLRHAQKIEAIGTLAGGIAHDFNNIITAINGYGTILEMNLAKDDPLLAHVEAVLVAADRAAELTRSLLTFSRKQEIEPRPLLLNEIVTRSEKLLRRLIREDIELKVNLTADNLTVMADTAQIEQVLMNLVTNARDAMPRGGVIRIATAATWLDQDFIKLHGYGEPGGYALLSFEDNGSGMEEKTRQRIFEPFFTTKDSGSGTGLGLAVCYGIIKRHKGYITCSGGSGKGTIFNLYLPLVTTVQVRESSAAPVWLPGGKEVILLAEDDDQVRSFCRELLERYGYKVFDAADGNEALARFIEHRNEIDLLILDVIMPRKNGREVHVEIIRMNPGMRVIFVSGYTADVFTEGEPAGKDVHFLAKPIIPGELLRFVRKVLDDRG